MKRVLALLIVVLPLALAPGAHAKGPTSATIEGPEFTKALAWDPRNPTKRTPGFFKLVQGLGFFHVAFGAGSLSGRPAGELGPKYTITYGVPTGRGRPAVVRQDLYPYAAGGPVTYMPPGQKLFVNRATAGGWYRAGEGVKAALVRRGLPSTPPSPEAGSGSGSVAAVGVALLVGVFGALGVAALRRRPRPTPV